MKKLSLYVLVIFELLLNSCTSIFFEKAQPIDSKNLKSIPKELQGTWIKSNDTIIISRSNFHKVEWHYEALSKIELDTNKLLVIKDNLIYDFENDSLKGFEFSSFEDSIVVSIPDRLDIALGDSVALRKVSKNLYTLNLRKDSIWWEVFLIERKNDLSILIKYPRKADLKILRSIYLDQEIEILTTPNNEDKLTTSEFKKYWSVNFTRKNLRAFVKNGGFSDTTLVLDEKYRVDE